MYNKNSSRSYYPLQNDSKHFRPSHDLSDLENPDLLPDKAPPYRTTLQKTYIQNSGAERPDTRYQSINYSDNFKSQATGTESISYDDTSENKRLSMWPRNQKDLKRGLMSNNENKSPAHSRERVPSKTLTAQSGLPVETEKSKSRSRIRSSLYGSTENEYGKAKEYISPRFRKAKVAGTTKNNKSKSKREGKDFSMTIQSPLNTQKDTERSNEGQGGRLWVTEKLNPKKLLSPSHEEKKLRRGHAGKGRQEKERSKSKRSEASRNKGNNNKVPSFDDKVSKSLENREYKENNKGSRRFNTRDFSEYNAYEDEYRGWDNSREHRERFGSREYQDYYKSAQEQSRVIELEEEVKDREHRLEHMNRFQHDLYGNYLEVKGALETARDENQTLLDDVKYYVNQNEILKRELNMMEHQNILLADENQKLLRDQVQRSELIGEMEFHIGRLKAEVASLTKKCNDQTEGNNTKVLRIERELQELRHENGNLEKQVEDYQKHKEIRYQEERSLLKSLDERNHQIWELRQRNEKLAEEVEKLKEQKEELLKRSHSKEKEASAGKYGPEIYEPKRLLEQTLTQGKYENSPEAFYNMRKSRAETDKVKGDADTSKVEGIARSTLRKTENLDASAERLSEPASHRDRGKVQKSLDFDGLSKIIKEVMQEIGVEDIHIVVKKLKEIQENGRTEKKFVNAILDLVYKCSNKNNSEGKPTTRQAWKWLQNLMEEYMLMKKQKNSGGKESAIEKEIIKNLTSFLESEKTEIVEKVKTLASENIQMKGVINKLKAAGVEHSFGIGEVEKLLDRHPSYSSQSHSYSTAKFEETNKGHRGVKEISFGRGGAPNLRKMVGKESFEIAEVMVKKESD